MIRNTDADVIGTRLKRDETEGLDLFDAARNPAPAVEARADQPPPPAPPRGAPAGLNDDRHYAIARLKDAVLPLLIARAERRKDAPTSPGVTADDVVEIAQPVAFAALLGTGQRSWSWVGPWLASLARAGQLAEFVLAEQVVRRRSKRPDAHGNLQIVYLHPSDVRALRTAA